MVRFLLERINFGICYFSFQVHFWAFPANSGPFLHVWWKHTFGHWERNLFRCPDILRPYNMAIFPKLKHHTLQTRQHSSPHLHRSQLAILQLKKTAKLISPNDICPSLNRQYPTNLQKSIQSSRSSGSSSLICCTASTFWPYMPHDISVKRSNECRQLRHPSELILVGGFQPVWKICKSNWVHLPQIGMKIKKSLSCHHLVIDVKTKTLVISKRQATSLGTSGDPQPGEDGLPSTNYAGCQTWTICEAPRKHRNP